MERAEALAIANDAQYITDYREAMLALAQEPKGESLVMQAVRDFYRLMRGDKTVYTPPLTVQQALVIALFETFVPFAIVFGALIILVKLGLRY